MQIFGVGFSYFLILELMMCIFWSALDLIDSTDLYKCNNFDGNNENEFKIPEELMEMEENEESHVFKAVGTSQEINCPLAERFNYTFSKRNSTENHESHKFLSGGVLRLNNGSNFRIYRNTRDYCIQSISEDSVTITICNVTCGPGTKRPCINKCCGPNKILGYDDNNVLGCQDPKNKQLLSDWKPKFYKTSYLKLSEKEQNAIQPNWVQYLYDDCPSSLLVEKHPQFKGKYNEELNTNGLRLLRNGTLTICNGSTGHWVELKDDFCVDSLQNFGEEDNISSSGDYTIFSVFRLHCSNDSNTTINHTDWERRTEIIYTVLYHVLMPIASVNLFFVIIVYTLLWDKHKAHGYTIFSYVCSLFLLYLSLSIAYAIPIQTPACKIAGVLVHFLFISTFCYLTAINFDIWWTFRKMKNVSPSKHIKKYIAYSAICCTAPTIIVAIGLAMDSFNVTTCPVVENEVKYLSPKYGEKVCGVSSAAQGWYIYFPVGILLFCNGIFFIMTVISMYIYKKDTNCILRGQSTKEDRPVWLFIKLFIVMGIVWVLEFLGWALTPGHSGGMHISWFILIIDGINLLQAVAIFYIFVCKRHIFLQLWQKHVWLRSFLSLLVKAGCCQSPPDNFLKSMTPHGCLDAQSNGIPNATRSRNTSIQSNTSEVSTISGSISSRNSRNTSGV